MIERSADVLKFDDANIPVLKRALDAIREGAIAFRFTSTVPTASTVGMNEIVIYDNGSGAKRIYLKTGKNNLGYVALT